ncbi:unnamed protein product [Parajaminaea phylloscopi]
MSASADPPPVHLDINQVSKSIAILGAFITVYGQVSYTLKERLHLSEPLIAVALGIVVGPYVLNWVDPRSWGTDETYHELTYQLTRIVVGIQVLFTGIDLPKAYLRKEIVSLSALLLGIMTIAWFVTGLLVWGIIGTATDWHLTYLECLALAAAVTPTDPVLANSIVKGRYAEKHVPPNIRNIILAESGANDGLGFPFLYLAIYIMRRSSTSLGSKVGQWFYGVVVYQILVAVVYGFVVGYVARKTLKWAEARQYIDKDSFFAFGLGLALLTLGTTGLFGSDDILACFVAGNSFTWDDWFRIRSAESDVQDILDMLLNAAVFVYIGAIIPWDFYHRNDVAGIVSGIDTWRAVVFVLLVLLVRRPPWVIAARKAIPALRTLGESAFVGFFGAIGVSAVFYIEVALRELPADRQHLRELYNPIVLFTVFGSVLVHGITIPLSKHGPNIVRKTATLSQTRSITFTTIPASNSPAGEAGTTTRAGGEGTDSKDEGRASAPQAEPDKVLWNPLWSLALGISSVVLFWRKDSFWRRDPATRRKEVAKDKISEPSHPVRRSSIHEGAGPSGTDDDGPVDHNEAGNANSSGSPTSATSHEASSTDGHAPVAASETAPEEDAGPRGIRPPPPALQLPTTMRDRIRGTTATPSQSGTCTPNSNSGVRFEDQG